MKNPEKRVDAVSIVCVDFCSHSTLVALARAMAVNAGKPWLAMSDNFALGKEVFDTAGIEVRYSPFTKQNAVA